jgi:hypothetical protein
MRWLMILLLVSLVAMLVAAAGVARHVWKQHKKLSQEPPVDTGSFLAPVINQPVKTQPVAPAKKPAPKTKNKGRQARKGPLHE